ncbi:MAG: hypothetical protein L3J06_05085 [Cyclobacteriaceae bacterium]|nr:hypothetical protein [Cyclobacteriaceae bacterium]
MKRINPFSILMVCVVLAGCKADMICPAYQSYFLIDETAQRDQFGYFAQDSLPRRDIFHSTLDKNGLVAKTNLLAYVDQDWVRNREIRTVNMEVIYPIISDSLLFAGDVMMYAETDVVDSTALDSARMAAQTFRYGADQKYYNWYFRGKLVWKDELEGEKSKEEDSSEEKVEKAGFFGFFKNLFKKKDKTTDDTEGLESSAVQEKGDLDEEPEKKGLFKKKEKKPKEKKPKEKKPKEPKPKEPKPKKDKSKNDGLLKNATPEPPAKEEDDGEDDF